MKTLLLVPLASCMSFFGGFKLKEYQVDQSPFDDSEPPAPALAPIVVEGLDPEAFKKTLEASQLRTDELDRKYRLCNAEIKKRKEVEAAAAGAPKTNGDPFLDMMDALWRMEVLATDVSLFVLDCAFTSVGVEHGAREKTNEVTQVLRQIQGWVADTTIAGISMVETYLPSVHGYIVQACGWMKEQFRRFSAFCDGIVARFLERHPEHKDSLVAQNSALGIGLLILIPALFVWDLYLLGSCMLWCWILPSCLFCWCCARRQLPTKPAVEGARAGVAAVKEAQKEEKKEKIPLPAAAEVLTTAEVMEAKEAAAAATTPKEATTMSPKESMKETPSTPAKGQPNPSPKKKGKK